MSRFTHVLVVLGVSAALTAGTTVSSASAAYECFGQTATIVGTPGDDVLIGREDTGDVIVGLGGDDIIRGAEDVNSATAPGDRLCGGTGDDYIRGGVGEDRIQGGRGADDVDGSFQRDVITQGGPGDDRVADCDSEYSGGVRIIKGGPGDDWMCVDIEVTRMYGEQGHDTLIDLDCGTDSRLVGGSGADTMESYFDNLEGATCSDIGIIDHDRLNGGDGADRAVVNAGDHVVNTEGIRVV